jgi:hypothetical protein
MVLAALALSAGTGLVQAVVTDGWEGIRHKVARLFGRGEPDPQIEKRLDATQQAIASAGPGDLKQVEAAQASQWQTRFADLLSDYPDAEPELAELVREMKAARPVKATDHSIAAGGDISIKAESGGLAAGVIHGNVTMRGAPPDPLRPGPTNG